MFSGYTQCLALESYCIYLLLDDKIREAHKAELIKWVRSNSATQAADLGQQARELIEGMAISLHEQRKSLIGSNVMLMQAKQG